MAKEAIYGFMLLWETKQAIYGFMLLWETKQKSVGMTKAAVCSLDVLSLANKHGCLLCSRQAKCNGATSCQDVMSA
eukprot:scaffold154871_cov15-Tisochrysis_lutea.AAC.3